MTAKVQLSLRGVMDHLRLVWQTGETLLDSIPFEEDPEGTRYNVLLAVQEMVTNVLRHAYGGNEQRPIDVEFAAEPSGFTAVLRDQGPGFDPLAVQSPMTDGEAMPDAEGGYGIMITRMVMDDVEYHRDGDWNVLTLRKSVRVPSLQGG